MLCRVVISYKINSHPLAQLILKSMDSLSKILLIFTRQKAEVERQN